MMASNQLFGISYHLENHLLVKANDFNKDNTCNENPEEDLSVDVLDKDGSSCMGTLQPEINPKKQPLLPIQEEQQLHFAKMDSSLSSNSQMRSGTEASGSTRFALRTRKQTKDLLQSQASPQLLQRKSPTPNDDRANFDSTNKLRKRDLKREQKQGAQPDRIAPQVTCSTSQSQSLLKKRRAPLVAQTEISLESGQSAFYQKPKNNLGSRGGSKDENNAQVVVSSSSTYQMATRSASKRARINQ